MILSVIGCGKGSVGDCYVGIWRGHHAVGYVPGNRHRFWLWFGKTMIPQLREGVKKLAEGGEEGAQEIRWVRLKLTTIYFRRKENVDIEFCGDKLLWIQLLLCFRNIAEQLEKGLTDFGAKDYSELDWMWFFHKYLSQCAERHPYSELDWMWYPPFIFASIKYCDQLSCFRLKTKPFRE